MYNQDNHNFLNPEEIEQSYQLLRSYLVEKSEQRIKRMKLSEEYKNIPSSRILENMLLEKIGVSREKIEKKANY